MYLERQLYVYEDYRPDSPEDRLLIPNQRHLQISGKGFESVSPQAVCGIIERAGYWRKANQIHNWIVENVQEGVDECQRSYFPREKMNELLDICTKFMEQVKMVDGEYVASTSYTKGADGKMVATKNMAAGKVVANPELCEKLLPSTSGFFFGGTDYDEWYVKDIERTVKFLTDALDPKYDDWSYYYQASW